ncbi:MAG: hypothetical protein SWO11_04520 [Thermodesulfobacteriota bacterium]|nr:hypothetical protein [Thermodesulfobacteriota bacterium]
MANRDDLISRDSELSWVVRAFDGVIDELRADQDLSQPAPVKIPGNTGGKIYPGYL